MIDRNAIRFSNIHDINTIDRNCKVLISSAAMLISIFSCYDDIIEPPRDKTNKITVRPPKTQISLGIRPDWSESLLSARRKLGDLTTHLVHNEDSDQTGRMPRLVGVFAGRSHFVGLVMRRLKFCYHMKGWYELEMVHVVPQCTTIELNEAFLIRVHLIADNDRLAALLPKLYTLKNNWKILKFCHISNI